LSYHVKLCISLGMTTNLKQLDGTVLVDQTSHPQTICYFNEQDLPDDIIDRFQYLFQVRNKWTFNEIQPFLEYYLKITRLFQLY
jgi:sister chromatid cohesion protein DCC1